MRLKISSAEAVNGVRAAKRLRRETTLGSVSRDAEEGQVRVDRLSDWKGCHRADWSAHR